MSSRRHIPAMCRLAVTVLLVAQLLSHVAAAGSKSEWLTLDGSAPKVVARGGCSGLFPDSSSYAYHIAISTSVSDVVLWCDVQLTKDAVGICFPSLNLENSSSITYHCNPSRTTYSVNGVSVSGIFTIDYSKAQLQKVSLNQGIYSRTPDFDDGLCILTVEDVYRQNMPKGFWLNVQHDLFYSQHNLSMQSFLLGVISRGIPINYLSSPEVGFLRAIAPKLRRTTLVFRFLQEDVTEPTINQTYGDLTKNLTFIKTFADGILVPKSYIWPSDSSLYLLPHTSLVQDAHAAGLQVYAADFANDNVLSYNYSFNPVAEYLNYIDNGDFSVDGVLSDFPITPSAAIDCFAHLDSNSSGAKAPLVISHNGASGDYPGCTDLAYIQAISDGADYIDCSVQMSKDGVPFCLSSINLMDSTTVAQSGFITCQENIPELNMKGIFTFRLEWKDIQALAPAILNVFSNNYLYRNPKNKNAGKLVSLSYFLAIARNSAILSGVVIRIENAAYLVQNQSMSVTDAVTKALDTAGFTKQKPKKVMIQSTDSSVLQVFKGRGYNLVYELHEQISDVQNSTAANIKSFANAVVVDKKSVYPVTDGYIRRKTEVVDRFKAFNLSVYIHVFTNEFVSQSWDFYADINAEMNTFVADADIDGFITDFPLTAATYRRNRCLNRNPTPSYMLPAQPGSLMSLLNAQPPAAAPAAVLTDADVSEPPLPALVPAAAPSSTPTTPNASSTSDRYGLTSASFYLASIMIASALFFLG